jgi:hypothetical protein
LQLSRYLFGHAYAPSLNFFAFSAASSIPPTYMKARSGR